ncbi:MAG: 30S ribosomal protein S3 [Bacteroidia bacterium]|jgi:small subunit ribosomal protein S3|nr:30S ribosomal protein S3 [Bacteroidia bacterium]
MGQKSNPIVLRVGIIRNWESNWYGGNTFPEKILEDDKIRKYIKDRLPKSAISRVVIERAHKLLTVNIHTAKPGMIIGKGGKEVDNLKEELKKLTKKDVQVNILDIPKPELDARLTADSIARQIEGRIAYKRAAKQAIAAAMRAGAEGIKIRISGRLGGAEMARSEEVKEGRIPLHTFRADIDYAVAEAHTTYGRIGIKVWICRGEIYGKNAYAKSDNEKKTSSRNISGGDRRPSFRKKRNEQ